MKRANKGLAKEIAAHPLAGGLSAEHVDALARHATRARFTPGQLLLREGGQAEATFLIVSGRVALEIHAPGRGTVQIATAGPGEIVGWSWLAAVNRWHFDARATAAVEAIVLDGKKLLAACESDPALGYALLRRFLAVVTSRLEAVRLQLIDLYSPKPWGPVQLPWA